MPRAQFKIAPGLDVQETPALNQAGLSFTNLIRFFPDRQGLGLVQKLGGWTRYFNQVAPSIVRRLLGWADINDVSHLAVGCETAAGGTAQLFVITQGALATVTPTESTSDVPPVATSVAGSPYVRITDNTVSITQYDSVYIQTHIAIGGLVLFGLYQCNPDGFLAANQYSVGATNVLGQLIPALTGSSAAVLASFATTAGSSIVTVTLPNHGYVLAQGLTPPTFSILTPTTVGGITLSGNYIVTSVTDANTFTFVAAQSATATATATENNGNAQYTYNYGVGSIPQGTGYGVGGYGQGGYGTGTGITPSLGSPISADDWSLDNWGQVLIACPHNAARVNPGYQPIYAWDPTSGSPTATVIPQAPPMNDGCFVAMPQRQIVAWGSTFTGVQDPLLVRWCDLNNFNVWVGTVINQAGSFRLSRGSRIVSGMQGPQQCLLWTDLDLWVMQYVNLPSVYSFNQIGSQCGLIGKRAAAVSNGVVYWMGVNQFYTLDSNGVQVMPCSVWDAVFQNIDLTNATKIRCGVNSLFNEVTWFFPQLRGGGGLQNENQMYVKYNTVLNAWDFGHLPRSAWIDESVCGYPISSDPNTRLIYQHETSPDADGQPLSPSFMTGLFVLQDGDVKTFVDEVWPDMIWGPRHGPQNATVQITFYVVDFPGQTYKVYGPYSVTQATEWFNPRFRGRLVAIGMTSNDMGSFWRLGGMRYRYAQDGEY